MQSKELGDWYFIHSTLNNPTRCNFTQRPRVANCVRGRTCACSVARALETRGWCVKLEVDSLKLDRRKQKMFTERMEPVMLITCWYLCFPVSRALWFAIRCRCSASRRSASSPSPLTFFMIPSLVLCLCFLFQSCLLLRWSPLHNQPSLESAMPRAPVLATIRGCVTNFIAFLYKAWRKCAHVYI